jgi:hypothetical protein
MVTAVEREVGRAFYRGLTAALRKSRRQTPKHPTRTQSPRASCLTGSHSHRSMRFRRLRGVLEYQSQGRRRPRTVRLLRRPCRRGLRPCNPHRRDRGLDVKGQGPRQAPARGDRLADPHRQARTAEPSGRSRRPPEHHSHGVARRGDAVVADPGSGRQGGGSFPNQRRLPRTRRRSSDWELPARRSGKCNRSSIRARWS